MTDSEEDGYRASRADGDRAAGLPQTIRRVLVEYRPGRILLLAFVFEQSAVRTMSKVGLPLSRMGKHSPGIDAGIISLHTYRGLRCLGVDDLLSQAYSQPPPHRPIRMHARCDKATEGMQQAAARLPAGIHGETSRVRT